LVSACPIVGQSSQGIMKIFIFLALVMVAVATKDAGKEDEVGVERAKKSLQKFATNFAKGFEGSSFGSTFTSGFDSGVKNLKEKIGWVS